MVYAEIISGLWIGNVDMMYNKQFINDNNINIIINCTINFKFNEYPNIRNIRIPLTDVLIQNIDLLRNNKDKILSYIDESLNDNNILICCYDGVTISPFILSLYLIHYGNIDKNKIKQIIQSKNSTISMDYDLSLLDL